MGDTTFNVLDSAAATVTFRAQAVVGTTLVMMSVPSDTGGTALIGQKTMASSLSVAFASNQSTMTAFLSGGSVALAGGTALVTLAGGTGLVTLAGGTSTLAGGTASVTLAGGTASVNLNQVGGSTFGLGQAVMATSLPVAIASNQSNVPFNLVAFNGTTLTVGQQVVTASIPVVLPSNQVVSTQLTNVGGTALTLGAKNSTASIPVAFATDQVSPLGQNTSASSAPVALPSDQVVSTNLTQVGAVAFSLGQKIMATSIPVAIASNQSALPISVVGHTAMPASVADGVNIAWFGDKFGRGITIGSVRELRASQYGSTVTSAEFTVVNALNATTYADLYGLLLANTGATSTRVDIRYGTGSAVLMAFQVASSDTGGFLVSTGDAFPGSLVSTNFSWTAQCAATTNLSVTALYVKNNS